MRPTLAATADSSMLRRRTRAVHFTVTQRTAYGTLTPPEGIGLGDRDRYRRAMGIAAELLRTSWEESANRLTRRCEGLTDEEYLWAPTDDAWTIRPDRERPGRWTYDYDFAPPPPAPITTIGWRLVHIIADNEIYWEYAFGARQRTFPDLVVPGTALEALQGWHDSRRPITGWLSTATDTDLAELRPSHLVTR
jgi:hypothetical protein